AEIFFVRVALATDYYCWPEVHVVFSVVAVFAIFQQIVMTAKEIIKTAVNAIVQQRQERICACAEALKFAILTDKSLIPHTTQQMLEPIIGKYL
ncbi:MAG: S-methyl-5'-thioadenosine phosphorylase, partial [Desulfuromusa sp.]|nr:S-methyl-5'-thioadenosine phosphorylase [Desulfuromusa sp.]